jgi:hypothetical protein
MPVVRRFLTQVKEWVVFVRYIGLAVNAACKHSEEAMLCGMLVIKMCDGFPGCVYFIGILH